MLNQWTYHARLYRAARYSRRKIRTWNWCSWCRFGCGVDAITTDEVRAILERQGKFYTQIKIDEITNLGAVKIRLRVSHRRIGGEENHGIMLNSPGR